MVRYFRSFVKGEWPAYLPHMTHDFLYLYVGSILALVRSKFLNQYDSFSGLSIPSKKPFFR